MNMLGDLPDEWQALWKAQNGPAESYQHLQKGKPSNPPGEKYAVILANTLFRPWPLSARNAAEYKSSIIRTYYLHYSRVNAICTVEPHNSKRGPLISRDVLRTVVEQ